MLADALEHVRGLEDDRVGVAVVGQASTSFQRSGVEAVGRSLARSE